MTASLIVERGQRNQVQKVLGKRELVLTFVFRSIYFVFFCNLCNLFISSQKSERVIEES